MPGQGISVGSQRNLRILEVGEHQVVAVAKRQRVDRLVKTRSRVADETDLVDFLKILSDGYTKPNPVSP